MTVGTDSLIRYPSLYICDKHLVRHGCDHGPTSYPDPALPDRAVHQGQRPRSIARSLGQPLLDVRFNVPWVSIIHPQLVVLTRRVSARDR